MTENPNNSKIEFYQALILELEIRFLLGFSTQTFWVQHRGFGLVENLWVGRPSPIPTPVFGTSWPVIFLVTKRGEELITFES